jgi:hypothetical protein
MSEPKRQVEVCKCEHCGNEAEMVITCELLPPSQEQPEETAEKRERKTFTCVNCGNEADMIIDS